MLSNLLALIFFTSKPIDVDLLSELVNIC